MIDEIPKLVMNNYNKMTLEIEKYSIRHPIYFIKTKDFEHSDMCYLMYGWYLQHVMNIDDSMLSPITSNKREYLHKIKRVDWRKVFTEKITAKEILQNL